jgi:hypothetical protein
MTAASSRVCRFGHAFAFITLASTHRIDVLMPRHGGDHVAAGQPSLGKTQ